MASYFEGLPRWQRLPCQLVLGLLLPAGLIWAGINIIEAGEYLWDRRPQPLRGSGWPADVFGTGVISLGLAMHLAILWSPRIRWIAVGLGVVGLLLTLGSNFVGTLLQ
jgi:hypothetical protein